MDAIYETMAFPAGTLLFSEGEPGSCAFLIMAGRIEIFLARGGRDEVLAIRGAGEIVGEMAIIDNRPRSASARVIADCELTLVTSGQLSHRIEQTDPILRMCLGVVIERYRETVARLDQRQAPRPATSIAPQTESVFAGALKTLSLESGLRHALRNKELELFFQPIVRLPTRRLAGFEALLRWNHPTRGLVSPGEFIPVAEASGLIVEITAWCLIEVGRAFPIIARAALRNLVAVDPLFITVNISGHDLARPSFLESVATMLATSGMAPGSIKLEITESALMKDPAKAAAMLLACRTMGLGIAIDDFGTGYSSLSQLGTLPMTSIKIDQSFVRSMRREPTSRKIIQMILRLALELDVPVVAEGIEEREDERMLSELGCAYGQGYLFGRPAPLDETLEITRGWSPREDDPGAKSPLAKVVRCNP